MSAVKFKMGNLKDFLFHLGLCRKDTLSVSLNCC
uniref:Uncharacterized protein n=1 Tax=Anguilla anguilla TaxID=7936 RepID=A0A0E9SS28_ANGAN